jgi:hypothetical protein
VWVYIVGGIVSVVGGSELGFPLPQSYLDEHPEIKCVKLSGSDKVPEVGEYFTKNQFLTADQYFAMQL